MQSPKSGQILWHIREKEDAFIEVWSNSLAYQRKGGCIHWSLVKFSGISEKMRMHSLKSGQILWHIREEEDAFIEVWSNSLAYQRRGGCIHWSLVKLPGISENRRMHSLNPKERSLSLSCCRMATPIHNGRDELPNNRVSHRCIILCIGNTSINHKNREREREHDFHWSI